MESKQTEAVDILIPGETGVDMGLLQQDCVQMDVLNDSIKELDEALKQLKKNRDALRFQLASTFGDHGMQSIKHGGRTYSLRVDRFVSKKKECDMFTAIEALREADMGEFVTEQYASGQVRSHLRELHDEMDPGTPFEDALPEALRGLFNTSEKAIVTSTKS